MATRCPFRTGPAPRAGSAVSDPQFQPTQPEGGDALNPLQSTFHRRAGAPCWRLTHPLQFRVQGALWRVQRGKQVTGQRRIRPQGCLGNCGVQPLLDDGADLGNLSSQHVRPG